MNVFNVNDFKNLKSTKDSRQECLSKLSSLERKRFLAFVKSVNGV